MGSLVEELKRKEAAARAEADRLRARIEERGWRLPTPPGQGFTERRGDRLIAFACRVLVDRRRAGWSVPCAPSAREGSRL